MHISTSIVVTILGFAAAHPSTEQSDAANLVKRSMMRATRRGVDACAGKFEASGLTKRAVERRMAMFQKHARSPRALEKPKGKIDKRSAESVLATSHDYTSEGYTTSTSVDTLFASDGACVLNPVSEYGPYWVKGELVRQDLAEDQDGIPVIMDGQFIDVDTCEPLSGAWWDMWNCNSTGVYSGVVDGTDTDNIDNTWLRGIQQADDDGVVQFTTLFPGHYSGRATHTHVIARLDAELLSNNTLSGGTVAFMGHMFWDQDLVDEVEATSPYSDNTISLTLNSEDNLFVEEAEDADPVFNYIYLGDDISDGLFAWITIAVDTSASYDEEYSYILTANGGVAVSSDSDSSGNTDNSDFGDNSGNTDNSDFGDNSGNTDNSDFSDNSGNTDNSDFSDNNGNTDNSGNSDFSDAAGGYGPSK